MIAHNKEGGASKDKAITEEGSTYKEANYFETGFRKTWL